tara:strand:+ start:161 stop:565 length:405 start_codon:yes stop_codon:yes gene_type:complete
MYSFDTKIRVRYGETDQMGFVYYGFYAQYYEIGRVELLRSLGVSYKEIENLGYALPVVSMQINYKAPALYDDLLTVRTIIKKKPRAKIIFDYEIYNVQKKIINTAQVALVFVDMKTKKPCLAPKIVLHKFENIF